MTEKYYINVKELMEKYNINLPKPKPKIEIISITVELWSDLNVRH